MTWAIEREHERAGTGKCTRSRSKQRAFQLQSLFFKLLQLFLLLFGVTGLAQQRKLLRMADICKTKGLIRISRYITLNIKFFLNPQRFILTKHSYGLVCQRSPAFLSSLVQQSEKEWPPQEVLFGIQRILKLNAPNSAMYPRDITTLHITRSESHCPTHIHFY